MKVKELPPIEVLREHFTYDHETGELRWLKIPKWCNRKKIGDLAGYMPKNGYLQVRLDGQHYQAHRICWALHYGEDPYPNIIDHKEGVDKGNAIINLRIATHPENGYNTKINKKNTSGHRGVSYNKQLKKWGASITVNHKSVHLGVFVSKEDAITARLNYERENNIFVRG